MAWNRGAEGSYYQHSGGTKSATAGEAGVDRKKPRKSDLLTKACAACGRPFAWRKKWARVWEQVRYCSDRCRAAR